MGTSPGNPWKIFRISADGGTPEQLLPGAVNEFDPTRPPDGKQLRSPVWTAESAAARPVAIYLVDLQTRRLSKLPGSEGLFSPRWSPDGKHLAAVSSDSQRLVLFDLAAKKWSDLASGGVCFPRWSRDGKYIYLNRLGENASCATPTVRKFTRWTSSCLDWVFGRSASKAVRRRMPTVRGSLIAAISFSARPESIDASSSRAPRSLCRF